MRDVERLREKTEISLDDRQIAGLAVAALLLLGGVFALGLLVGKHLAAQTQPGVAAAELAIAEPGPAPVPAKAPAPRKEEPPPPEDPPVLAKLPAAVVAAPRPAVVIPPPPKPVAIASAVAPPAALPPPPKELGDFTVQVGASQDRADAQRLEQKARAAGLKPYVVEADLGEKGTWYRVRVGAFKDKDSASRFRSDVERELRTTAVVMSTH